MADDLKRGRYVGLTQSLRAVEEGKAEKIYIAKDADRAIIDKVMDSCDKHGVTVVYAESKKQLGKDSGIDVSAAVVCLLKQ